jgi:hypothetical protein
MRFTTRPLAQLLRAIAVFITQKGQKHRSKLMDLGEQMRRLNVAERAHNVQVRPSNVAGCDGSSFNQRLVLALSRASPATIQALETCV